MGNAKAINVNVTFKHTDASEALRNYAVEKITHCLQKFVHHDTDAHVVLKVERNRHIAEVVFNSDGGSFQSLEDSGDLYASIDKLVDTVSTLLRKHKEKLTKHH